MAAMIEPGPRANPWKVGLLGGFTLTVGGREVDLSADAERLVAFLSLVARRSTRAYVAGSLWPDCSQDRAFGNLRSALWRLKRAGGTLVHADARCLGLSSGTEVDTDRVETLSRRVLDVNCDAAGDALAEFRQLSCELLPGWYDEWTTLERERLRQLCLHTLETLAGQLTERGLYSLAIQAALTAVGLDQLRESPRRRLIEAHMAEGNYSDALREFRAYERLMRDELGVAPSRSFSRLVSTRSGQFMIS